MVSGHVDKPDRAATLHGAGWRPAAYGQAATGSASYGAQGYGQHSDGAGSPYGQQSGQYPQSGQQPLGAAAGGYANYEQIQKKRSPIGWWIAGAALLVAIIVVAALALRAVNARWYSDRSARRSAVEPGVST